MKELRHYRTPSQTIGNNYSPHVQHLRVKGLRRQLQALYKRGAEIHNTSRINRLANGSVTVTVESGTNGAIENARPDIAKPSQLWGLT